MLKALVIATVTLGHSSALHYTTRTLTHLSNLSLAFTLGGFIRYGEIYCCLIKQNYYWLVLTPAKDHNIARGFNLGSQSQRHKESKDRWDIRISVEVIMDLGTLFAEWEMEDTCLPVPSGIKMQISNILPCFFPIHGILV